MATSPVSPPSNTSGGNLPPATAPTPTSPAPGGAFGGGFDLPSYALGLITALLLLGGAVFFWPRPQPAAIQLQPPPAAPTALPTPAATVAPTPSPLVIFVSGAVAQPGLYTLAAGARIGDAIAAAGGLLPGVDGALINQAQPLVDGAQLHIPAPATSAPSAIPAAMAAPEAETQAQAEAVVQAEVLTAQSPGAEPAQPTAAEVATEPAAEPAPAAAAPPAGLILAQPLALATPTAALPALPARAATVELPAAGGLINVNTASGAELESLPGIGPAKAQAIIANRPYATVEELDRVPGIGPATLEQIRTLVSTE